MSIYVIRREIFSPNTGGEPARLLPLLPGSPRPLTRTSNCTQHSPNIPQHSPTFRPALPAEQVSDTIQVRTNWKVRT